MNKTITFNLKSITTIDQLHTLLRDSFGFPEFYGKNFPALVDCWSSLRYPRHQMSTLHLDSLEDSLEMTLLNMSSCNEEIAKTLISAVELVNQRAALNKLSPVIKLVLGRS